MHTTDEFERAYNVAANLVNANSWREIMFGRNATEMINLVMRGLEYQFSDGDNIVVTALEHNSNYVPWHGLQQNLRRTGKEIDVRIVPFDSRTGEVDMGLLESMVDANTKIVAATGASNFMGIKPDVKRIGEIAHASGHVQQDGSSGSYLLVDAAQLVPGTPVDVQDLGCDFLAWSFHKMALPLGVGGLYGKKEVMETLDPFLYGGDMILDVLPGKVEFQELPWRFTAGTPNILGVIGTGVGMEYMINLGRGGLAKKDEVERVGKRVETAVLMNTPRGDFEINYRVPSELQSMFRAYMQRHPEVVAALRDPAKRLDRTREVVQYAMGEIMQHEEELTQAAIDRLQGVPGITMYGPQDATKRTGLMAFNVDGIEPHALAFALNSKGVEVRNGVHCASLAHHQLGIREMGSVRMSFYVYNDMNDVDKATSAVYEVVRELR